MAGYDGRMMVKQYVAEVQSRFARFRVFTTQDEKFYLFDLLDPWGCSSTIHFPVRKADLKPEVRRALRHGRGNVDPRAVALENFKGRKGGKTEAEARPAGGP